MSIQKIILATLTLAVYSGCGEDKTTDDTESADVEYTVNAEYVGDWTQTYFAQYDGEACSGDPTFEDNEIGMNYTLNDDGSVLITGSLGCEEETAASTDMCQSTWGASGTTIKIGAGAYGMEYTVSTDTDGSTIMTSEVQGQAGSSPEDASPICQYSKYTKQE